jgi:fatty-acyl-CoA synthase
LSILDDLNAFRRAGVLRPLGPRTLLELGRQIAREGVKAHLIYTIHGKQDANKAALIYEGRTTTWGELLDRMKRLSNHFVSLGAGKNAGVAVMIPNRPEFLEANAAAMRIGARLSFINPRAPAPEAKSLVERAGARVLVTHRDDVDTGGPVLRTGEQYEIAIASAPAGDPTVDRSAKGEVVVFTSGTTGRPKGAVRSLESSVSPKLAGGFLRLLPLRTSDIHMVVCPMYHASGSGFATISQVLGNTLVLVEKFSPEAFCEHVQQHKVSTTTVVPTMLHQLASWPETRNYDLSSLRVVVCTGSPLREEVRREARELVGDVVYDMYGSTEMAMVTIATPEDQRRKPGSVGKPVPGVDLKITDPEGKDVRTGERGEIWASSAARMTGYIDDPELTDERLRDGYVSVRDVGYLDEDGYLFVVDRADDMIISGGVNVYPAETEVALNSHPKVDESVVIGVPDPKWGQRIVAAVVPSGDVTVDELIEWSKENSSYAAVPKEIRFMDALPRNDIGKVDKKQLAQGWDP